jgi:hypothetical protein
MIILSLKAIAESEHSKDKIPLGDTQRLHVWHCAFAFLNIFFISPHHNSVHIFLALSKLRQGELSKVTPIHGRAGSESQVGVTTPTQLPARLPRN